jgi:hypothetical protein
MRAPADARTATLRVVDKLTALDVAIRRLYEVISFEEGGAPDWMGMRTLFAPAARITRVTPEGVDALDVPGFEAMFSELMESGAVLSFFEQETARRVEMFGAVAHVLSAYETKRSPHALAAFGRGINSIQLMWADSRWLVISLLWDEGLSPSARAVERLEVIYDDTA